MTQSPWMRISEASAYFSIPQKSLYSLIARGLLPPGTVLRLGRQLRVNAAGVEAAQKIQQEKNRRKA